VGSTSGAFTGCRPVDPILDRAVMNCIRRIRRSLAGLTRRAGLLPADGLTAPAALRQPAAAATGLNHAPTAARLQAPADQRRPAQPPSHPDHGRRRGAHLCGGGDRVPDAGHAAARGRQRRRTGPFTRTASGVLPRTIQLCVHCQQRPAGFWVRCTGGTVMRRPWCLSCCQDLDRDRYDVITFGG
jgi:hypothetical protein